MCVTLFHKYKGQQLSKEARLKKNKKRDMLNAPKPKPRPIPPSPYRGDGPIRITGCVTQQVCSCPTTHNCPLRVPKVADVLEKRDPSKTFVDEFIGESIINTECPKSKEFPEKNVLSPFTPRTRQYPAIQAKETSSSSTKCKQPSSEVELIIHNTAAAQQVTMPILEDTRDLLKPGFSSTISSSRSLGHSNSTYSAGNEVNDDRYSRFNTCTHIPPVQLVLTPKKGKIKKEPPPKPYVQRETSAKQASISYAEIIFKDMNRDNQEVEDENGEKSYYNVMEPSDHDQYVNVLPHTTDAYFLPLRIHGTCPRMSSDMNSEESRSVPVMTRKKSCHIDLPSFEQHSNFLPFDYYTQGWLFLVYIHDGMEKFISLVLPNV